MLSTRITGLGRTLVSKTRPSAAVLTTSRPRFSTTPLARTPPVADSPLRPEAQAETGPQPSYGPVGVAAALTADPSVTPRPTLLTREFSLADRVALITGANRGLALEMASAYIEAGARAVYCVDVPKQPGEEWQAVRDYYARMEGLAGEGRLEYISADVRDQDAMWKIGETIGDREGRFDACIAGAGILKPITECLEYPAQQFRDVMDVNVNGVFFTAQAAGRQMARFGNGGSIVLIASISGHITNQDRHWASYNTSKSAVLQMARSLACELGVQRIRVNSISPGYIYTQMTQVYFDKEPHLRTEYANANPLKRLGRPDELRGVVTWLASDASTFCTGSDMIVSGGHHAW